MKRQCHCGDCRAMVLADDHHAPGVDLRCRWCGGDVDVECDGCHELTLPGELVLLADENQVLCRLCQRLCCFCGEDRDVLCNGACRSCADRFTSGWAADGSYSWFLIERGTAAAAIERGDTLPAPDMP